MQPFPYKRMRLGVVAKSGLASSSFWEVLQQARLEEGQRKRDDAGDVLSSWGPYTSTIGQVYKKNDLSMPAVSTKALDSTNKGKLIEIPSA